MKPSKKDPKVEKLIDGVTVGLFGRSRTASIEFNKCVTCGKEVTEFKDELSRKEYTISGMCQACQDSVFG